MKKRIGASVLALSLALSLALPLSAAGVVSQEEAAQVVGALNIMVGDENGDLQLDKTVTEFKRHSKARFTQDNFIESIV